MKNPEWSDEFNHLRKNRCDLSFYKYGSARENFGAGRVDALATAYRCMEAFERDHNSEHLVDAANYLMFRFMYPMEGESFRATDDRESVPPVGVPVNME